MDPKVFLQDSYLFELTTQIQEIEQLESNFRVKLCQTIFHPQGGGQPNDVGFIQQEESKFVVENLQNSEDGNVWHIGNYENLEKQFNQDQPVQCFVDENSRRLNARIHSAGHLLDIAVNELGYKLVPGKGYHFPVGAYVEYQGNIEQNQRDEAMQRLTEVSNRIINQTQEAREMIYMPYEEAKEKYGLPSFIPAGTPIRVIKLTANDEGCPCGGTHVNHVSEIGGIQVTKIQKKGKNLRVSYSVSQDQKMAQLKFLETIGISYLVKGSGQPIIWLHGLLGNCYNLLPLAKQVQGEHFLLNARNHGKSFHSESHSYLDLAEDVFKFTQELGLQEVGIIGHSMGAKTSLITALSYPQIAKFIIMLDAAPIDYNQHNKDFMSWTASYLVNMQSVNLNLPTRELILDQIRKFTFSEYEAQLIGTNLELVDGQYKWRCNPKVLSDNISSIANFPEIQAQYSGKALIVAGEESTHTSLSPAVKEAGSLEALYSPYLSNFSISVIKNARHWVHAQNFEETLNTIQNFINK